MSAATNAPQNQEIVSRTQQLIVQGLTCPDGDSASEMWSKERVLSYPLGPAGWEQISPPPLVAREPTVVARRTTRHMKPLYQ